MKLTFIGADHEVTGSCHVLQGCGKNILVDYGMEQGRDIYVNMPLPIKPSEVDYVLITHAHIDHTGYLPLLYKEGFRGQIVATKATVELCRIMLLDSAHIQESEAEWKNRKAKRAGKEQFEPAYTVEDAKEVTSLLQGYDYDQKLELCPGVSFQFTDVGHLLGSAAIQVWISENGVEKKIVFSGDIGNTNQPLLRDPKTVSDADYVLVESTYGDRVHEGDHSEYEETLTKVLRETFDQGGNVVIPSFAVGRTQELLYFIRKIKVDHLLPEYENFEVFVDSPLANEATTVFMHNEDICYDKEALELIHQGINPISFPGLRSSITVDDSKAINEDMHPKVILSASGMCDAGRIRHHLKYNLWRPECTILFVGYQAENSLGRALLDGAKHVKLFGETIQVNARIEKLNGVSGHADVNGLLNWMRGFKKAPKQTFVVHGEDGVCDIFAKKIEEELGIPAKAPFSGAEYDLLTGEWLKEGNAIPIPRKEEPVSMSSIQEKGTSKPYGDLLEAEQMLLSVIHQNKEGANKDLQKFRDEILNLCKHWER